MFHLLNFSGRKILVTFLIILVLTMVTEIWSLNRLSTFGDQISKLEQTRQELTLENLLLKNQIDERASLKKMVEYASLYGFIKPKNVQYVNGL